MAFHYKQGKYTPQHPEKYIGDPTNIVYRSSWELEVNKFFDNNPKVLNWSSEELVIPYYNPVKQRMARYFPDYYIKYMTKDGDIVYEVVEVKPLQQTRRSRSRNPRIKLVEDLTAAVNAAKWAAATEWCTAKQTETGQSHKFRVITETSIYK